MELSHGLIQLRNEICLAWLTQNISALSLSENLKKRWELNP